MEKTHERSGHRPAMAGFDYLDFYTGGLATHGPENPPDDYDHRASLPAE